MRPRPFNALLLGTSVIYFVLGLARASGEPQNDNVEVRIGSALFAVPRAFVNHWLPKARGGARLAVEFGYPDGEPLGLMRFGGDIAEWMSYQKTIRGLGRDIISVEIREARSNSDIKDRREADRMMESACRFLGGEAERYRDVEIEFVKCAGKEGDLSLTGYSAQYDMSFKFDKHMNGWRLSRLDRNNRTWLGVDIVRKESLRNWKAIVDHANRVIAMWKK